MEDRRARRRAAACACLAALALSVGAGDAAALRRSHGARHTRQTGSRAQHGHTIYQSPDLWASIDVCSAGQPHTVGVRGSMPGSGIANELMFMRFQLQYLNSNGLWVDIGSSADSGFLGVGPSNFKRRQAGRNFTIQLQPGSRYIVRGVVTFEWRRRGHVVRNAQKATTGGHQAIAGANPPGYSAAVCELLS